VRNFLEIKDESLRTAVTTLMRALKDHDERQPHGNGNGISN